jgi:glycosyltransferase involved in cell wall biosynthesis
MSSPPLRLMWQNLGLPRALTRTRTDAILGPFNLLPLRGLPPSVRRGLIVSNIGPFTPEVSAIARGYQAARNGLLRSLTLRSIATADHVFLLSLEASELLGPALLGKSVEMLPMSPPPPDIVSGTRDTALPFDVPSRSFAVVGDLMPNKGIEDAVRAVATFDRNDERPSLLVVGNPVQLEYARRLRALASTEAPGSVRFVSGLSQEQALATMRRSRALVFPSRVENTSRVPVEAMAVGTPVVAADVPNNRASCGDAALYWPPGDHEALSRLMIRLLDDDGLADGLRRRGEERLAGRDWLTATRTILETLQLL